MRWLARTELCFGSERDDEDGEDGARPPTHDETRLSAGLALILVETGENRTPRPEYVQPESTTGVVDGY